MKLTASLTLFLWAYKVSAKNAVRKTHVVKEGSVGTRSYNNRPRTSHRTCVDDIDWYSEDEDGQYHCYSYKEWEEPGCPTYGGDVGVGTNGVTAWEACCYCQLPQEPDHTQPIPDDVYSPFEIYTVDSPGPCFLSAPQVQKLNEVGVSKVMCPFGVLVVGTSSFRDVYMKLAANIVAAILDPNGDGVPDDTAVIRSLTYQNDEDHKGAVLHCGSTEEDESTLDALGNVFDYGFSCQVWKVEESDRREVDGVLMEEAFHMVHQRGYARVYPNEFGLMDYTSSIAARETASLECVQPGYFHPENQCPGSPRQPGDPAPIPLDGTCNYPSCDVAEFYKMALFLARGMGWDNDPNSVDVWASDFTPTKQEEVLDMLSTEFKNMINNPRFHQIQGPLTSDYYVPSAADWLLPTPCVDDPNWYSEDSEGQYYCSDYASGEWEWPGCPTYGGDEGVGTHKTANEACCFCQL